MSGVIAKPCSKCGAVKPLDAFCLQRGGRYGRHPRCRACRSEQEKARYVANRDAILARQKADPKRKQYQVNHDRKKKYGLLRSEYDAMVTAQGGRCLVCGVLTAQLCVDHDHESGAIRGLVCSPCNLGIGHFGDDPVRLRAAAEYLERAASVS